MTIVTCQIKRHQPIQKEFDRMWIGRIQAQADNCGWWRDTVIEDQIAMIPIE